MSGSAVLGSYFLQERLGTLGKLGCAMCLLGSVVIVLHAPPDKPVESIEEILSYALKPGMLPVGRLLVCLNRDSQELTSHSLRISHLLLGRSDILNDHDLSCRAGIW